MNEARRRAARVVIALDAPGPAEYALEIARCLPAGTTTELLGMFVEEARLLEHAQSRLAREVIFSGRQRRLDSAALERQVRAQAAQVQRRFERAAAGLGLRHAFRVARGEIAAELIRAADEAEALVVAMPAHSRQQSVWDAMIAQLLRFGPQAVLFARQGWSTGRSVVALVTDAGEADVLRRAGRIAAHSGSPLTVLLADRALEQRERIAPALASVLRTEGLHLPEPAKLAAQTARSSAAEPEVREARLLVLAAGESADAAAIAALHGRMRGALMLVRPRAAAAG